MIIYKITNQINGKSYIGQTKNSIKYRWNRHKAINSQCLALAGAIKKYSKENFTISILAEGVETRAELNSLEGQYIKLFNTLSPNGYNLISSGDVKDISEETRNKLKMSAGKGEDNANYGKRFSEERKKNISDALKGRVLSEQHKLAIKNGSKKGENSPFFGKPPHSNTIQSVKNNWMNNRDSLIQSLRLASKDKRMIIRCNETGEIYESQQAAAKALGLYGSTQISRNLRGLNKTVKGLTFSKVEK